MRGTGVDYKPAAAAPRGRSRGRARGDRAAPVSHPALQRRADHVARRRADLDLELLAVRVLAPHRVGNVTAAVIAKVQRQGLGAVALAARAELRGSVARRDVRRPRGGEPGAGRLDLVDLLPPLRGEPAPAIHHRLGAVLRLALLDLLERAVLLVAPLHVAVLPVLDLARPALALVADREARLVRHLVAPGLLGALVELLDRHRAGPAVGRDVDRGALAAHAAQPDPEPEDHEHADHVRPDPPPAARLPGRRAGRRRCVCGAADLGGAVEHRAALRAVVRARRLRRAARGTGPVRALVDVPVAPPLLALAGEVALVGVLRRAAVGAVALALGEQPARVAVIAVPEHLEVALALLAFLPHRARW